MSFHENTKSALSLAPNIKGLFGDVSILENKFYCIGQVFLNKEILTIEQLFNLIVNAYEKDELANFMSKLSGFYAFVLKHDDYTIAVVDRLRSRPLFFTNANDLLELSDSAQWLVEQLTSSSGNQLSEQELIQAGYVSGENTLVQEINQIPAGMFLVHEKNQINLKTYYHFTPSNSTEHVEEQYLIDSLERAMQDSINELIMYANNRQIVVPLSGGYDSRAIAVYLKKAGYHNIVTFTFGKLSSKEVLISKKVANALGFEWHFVEYNKKLWRTTSKSQLFNNFLLFISSYVSVPNVQVYPAIQSLIEKGVIEPNAIIVPGHTGDFISGGHIPKQLLGLEAKGNEDAIVQAVLDRHYRNKSKLLNDQLLRKKLRNQIERYLVNATDKLPAASIFERWEYSERQAKFIVNSNRYYDFFNLKWWMPLWHNSMMNYWNSVPLSYRLSSSLWQSFVEKKYQEVTGDKSTYGNVSDQYHPILLRIREILDYFTDENSLYTLVPFYRWVLRKLKYPYSNGTVISYLAEKVIKSQKKSLTK